MSQATIYRLPIDAEYFSAANFTVKKVPVITDFISPAALILGPKT
jgi:hypothetical protein